MKQRDLVNLTREFEGAQMHQRHSYCYSSLRVGWTVSGTLYLVGDFSSESAVREAHRAVEILKKEGINFVLNNDYEVDGVSRTV